MNVAEWLMVAVNIGLFVVALVALNKKSSVKVSPQPMDVRVIEELHRRFAGREEFIAHTQDNEHQRAVLHRRLDIAIADYNEKFQRLPNEIVALLRNTGNLK